MKKILFVLCLILLAGCYTETTTYEIVQELPEPDYVAEKPIEGLHWDHMPLTYYFQDKEYCGDYEARRIVRAFQEIQSATNGSVSFVESFDSGDIKLNCSFIEDCYKKTVDIRREEGITYTTESICGYSKGLASYYMQGELLTRADIQFFGLAGFAETDYDGPSGFSVGSCGHINTEIHEILHVLGFGHDSSPESIMYYAEDGVGLTIHDKNECLNSKKEIDAYIIKELKEKYS